MTGTLAGGTKSASRGRGRTSPKGSRIFYTSLGSVDDFGLPAFQRLLLNGILWALDEPVPPADPRVVVRK
ncbi:MAG: hypothetical protein Ct9H300mP7_7010 [Verrucomicrobiota bacterium]|nr:MAG: hypothetical protein Ct9H300mP7_7010 [Verrucomicrobiota bacterium]